MARRVLPLILASTCALPAGAQEGIPLRLERRIAPPPPRIERAAVRFLSADRITGDDPKQLTATGSVAIRQRGAAIFADRLDYDVQADTAKRYGVPVYGHVSDASRLAGFTDGLEEGDVLDVGRERARILFIPAHTRGHIAYVFDAALALFCGDTLFAAGCGRLFEGTPEMMYDALCVKLAKLPDSMRVYCGHEYTQSNLRFAAHVEPDNAAVREKALRVASIRANAASDWHDATPTEMPIPSTLGEERATNPFVRARSAEELGRRRAQKDSF